MVLRGGVAACVLVRRGVAAAHLPARQADPEVAPRVTGGEALRAALDVIGQLGELDAVEV